MALQNIHVGSLNECLTAAHIKNYSGRIDVVGNGQKSSIYCYAGDIVWCTSERYWQQRWLRLVYKYCRYNTINEIELKDSCQGYNILIQWQTKGLVDIIKLQNFIQDNSTEVLFDILQQENRTSLTFQLDPSDRLTSCLPSANLKLVLTRSNEAWKQWCDYNLSEISPNAWGYSVLPSSYEQLKQYLKNQPDYSFESLKQVLDGEKSLRDIAILLNKPLIQIGKDLNHYWSNSLVLHEIEGLHSGIPLTHLSPNFNNLESQFDAPKVLENLNYNPSQKNYSIPTFFRLTLKQMIVMLITLILVGGGYAFSRFSKLALAPPADKARNQQRRSPDLVQNITLLADTFSGYSTFRTPDFQKALQAEGIALHYQSESDQKKRAALLEEGKADLMVTTLDRYLIQHPPGKIVALIDRTAGADAVVLNNKKYPALKSLQNLSQLASGGIDGEKLKIAFAGDTPSEYLALLLSTKFQGLDLSSFEVIRTKDAADAWKLMQDTNQGIAVAVLWEPFVSQSRKLGYNVTLSSKDVPNSIVDVLVASDRLLEKRPSLVSSLVETYYRRLDTTLTSESQLLDQIADDSKLPANDAASILKGIKFFTAAEAQNWLRNRTLDRTIGYTAGVLTLTGKLNRSLPNIQQLYVSEFIEKSASNTRKTLDLVRKQDPDMADRLLGKKRKSGEIESESTNQTQEIGQLKPRDLEFQTSSAKIALEGKRELDRLVQDVAQFNHKTVAIHIIGHTSKVGEAEKNRKLSRDRAQAVANHLQKLGLKHKIIVEGKGSDELLPQTSPNDKRNQRTEIWLERISNK